MTVKVLSGTLQRTVRVRLDTQDGNAVGKSDQTTPLALLPVILGMSVSQTARIMGG